MHGGDETPTAVTSRRSNAGTGEAGVALIEVTVAVVVLGLIITGVLVGIIGATRSAGVQRSAATNAAIHQDVAVRLLAAPYLRCGDSAQYEAELSSYLPQGGSVSVESVEYWVAGSNPATFRNSPCDPAAQAPAASADAGLQRITYEVNTPNSGADLTRTRTVLKADESANPEPPTDPIPGGQTCTISSNTTPSQVATNWVHQTLGQQNVVHQNDDHMDILYLNGTRRFSYVRFNVTPSSTCEEGGTLGSGRTILAARMELYTFNIGGLPACGANACWHAAERVQAAWNPATLTWSNQPCPGGGAIWLASCRADGQPGVTFQHGTGAFNWSPRFQRVEGTMMTDDVRSFYANPASNFGWRIREACDGAAGPYGYSCGTATPGFQFRSKEAPNPNQRPKLVVVYQ